MTQTPSPAGGGATAAAVGDGSVIDAKSRRSRPPYDALTTMVRVMVDEPIQLIAVTTTR